MTAFDLLNSKFNQLIFVGTKCTKVANLLKFAQAVYKISCSETSGRRYGLTHWRMDNYRPVYNWSFLSKLLNALFRLDSRPSWITTTCCHHLSQPTVSFTVLRLRCWRFITTCTLWPIAVSSRRVCLIWRRRLTPFVFRAQESHGQVAHVHWDLEIWACSVRLMHDDLHWLVIPQRVQYKLAVTVHRCLRHRAPRYLADYCVPVSEVADRQHLWSARCRQLSVPRVRRSTFGNRDFLSPDQESAGSSCCPRTI